MACNSLRCLRQIDELATSEGADHKNQITIVCKMEGNFSKAGQYLGQQTNERKICISMDDSSRPKVDQSSGYRC